MGIEMKELSSDLEAGRMLRSGVQLVKSKGV